jgi:starch-binding outer membrane protein, SusD/RagB family
MKSIIKAGFLLVLGSVFVTACKKQLDIKNPNQPNPETLKTENGIIAYGLAGVYQTGFRSTKYGDGVVGATFFSFVNGFHSLLGDETGIEAANVYANQVGCPDKVTYNGGATSVLNPGTPNRSTLVLREKNQNSSAGANPLFYEWSWMYNLNNACNVMLENVDNVSFSGDAATKKAVLKAWAYWWKGYAYSRIGSMYYAGLIRNTSSLVDPNPQGNYVTSSAVIAESNSNYDKAATILNALVVNADYTATIKKLIPDFCQVGKGLPPTPAMWVRNINTMKARNILVNKTTSAMTPADWNAIVTLTSAGMQTADYTFTARSNATNDLMTASGGTIPAKASGTAGSNTYKISERLVQDYKTGDQRKANNFLLASSPWIGNVDRGNAYHTRWGLKSGGNGLSGVIIYTNSSTAGAEEFYIAGTWEENQLMLAEATMYAGGFSAGSINTAMGLIDAVRTAQGAGLSAVAGVITTQVPALAELRMERRSGLAFKGLSFYDARRWKVIDPVSAGGGRTNCWLISSTGVFYSDCTIDYNYLDYWDVPDNELAYNPPAGGSAPVKNPKQ